MIVSFFLLKNLTKVADNQNINQIAIAGGVSANSELRNQLHILAQKHNWKIFIPSFEYCTDNAAMIAITGYYQFLAGDFTSFSVVPDPKMNLC